MPCFKDICKIRIPAIYFLFFLFASCKKENAFDCFKPNGKDITEIRYPGKFTSVYAYDKMDVLIVQGPEYKVEITAGKNIIKNLGSRIKDSVLILENNNKCNFVRGYKREISVKVTLPSVVQITNFGVGPIRLAEDFAQNKVSVRAENSGDIYVNGTFGEVYTSSHGNGDIYLSGSAEKLNIYMYGTNYTRAENFRVSDYLFISTESIGDAYFNLPDLGLMQYYINSNGNIYYKGNPKTIENFSDKKVNGKLLKQE